MLLAPQGSIRVIAIAVAKEGCESQVLEEFNKIIPQVRQEDGCLGYQFHVQGDNPNQFMMDEIWRDASALEVHGQTLYFKAMVKALQPLLAEPLIVHQYSPLEN